MYRVIKLIGLVLFTLFLVIGCSDMGDAPVKPIGNQPPTEPSSPNPPDDAENISVDVELSWTSIDPNNDPITYDVYFGIDKTDTPTVVDQTVTTYSPPEVLEIDEKYHWKIIAKDDQGNSVEGDWWEFTTSEGGGGGGGVSWSADIQPILDMDRNSCIGCHGGNGSLFLDSYSALMNGGVSGAAVIPGDADNSLLYKKVEGSTAGSQMPLGGPFLAQDQIDKIRDWINEGALDN